MIDSNCESIGAIKHFDWEVLLNEDGNKQAIPSYNISIDVKKSLFIDIDLEYIGFATDSLVFTNDQYTLGTTYYIGFAPFSVNDRKIAEPYNCDNRLKSSFDGVTDFNDFWNYSEYPYLANNLGSNEFLAYPPPTKYWTLTMDSNTCSPIHYQGIFTFTELSQCQDNNNQSLIHVKNSDKSVTLSATLHISIISPWSMSKTDSGFYRSYPLLIQPFEITLAKQMNIASSQNIDLFTTIIIGIWLNDNDEFSINILIQSADYLILTDPELFSAPFADAKSIKEIDLGLSHTSNINQCVAVSSFTCGQLFQIEIPRASRKIRDECPGLGLDFSGLYSMGFTAECPGDDVVCTTFLTDHGGNKIALDVESNFIDNSCDTSMYIRRFRPIVTVYKDDAFLQEINYADIYDRIYIQVELFDNSTLTLNGDKGNWSLAQILLLNVFVCTMNETNEMNLDHNTGIGGCLSKNMIENLQILNAETDENPLQIIEITDDNKIRFSFEVDQRFIGQKIGIQVQCNIKLQHQYEEGTRRRNLENKETTQMRHFMTFLEILPGETKNKQHKKGNGLGIGLLLTLISIVVLVIGIKWYRSKQSSKKETIQEAVSNKPTHGRVASDSICVENV